MFTRNPSGAEELFNTAKAENLSHTNPTITAAGLHSSDAKIPLFRLVSTISALPLAIFRTVDGRTPPTQTRLPKKGLFAANKRWLFETRDPFPKCSFNLSDFVITLSASCLRLMASSKNKITLNRTPILTDQDA